MKRKLEIYQYGSEVDPTVPARYSPSDWILISISESSPSEKSASIGAPQVSNSSASEASTGVREELASSSPQDLIENISRLIQEKIYEIGADLPCSWSPQEFTRMVIGEELMNNSGYLIDVLDDLSRHGFQSWYWEQAFDYITLIYGF